MKNKSLDLYMSYLSEFNLEEFRTSIQFTDSNEDNLKKMFTVTAFLRKKMFVFNLASQIIRAKSLTLTSKYNNCDEILKSVGTEINDISDNSYSISTKFAEATKKNKELLDRTQNVVKRMKKNSQELNETEKQFQSDLERLSTKANCLKSDIERIQLKRKAILTLKEQNVCSETSYLKDDQISLVKENLQYIGIGIQQLIDAIALIKIPNVKE